MLKPIHEIATVKDGNRIDGFFISDYRYLVNAKEFKYSYCWYVSMESMIELVKKNQVQYMVWNDKLSRLDISYSEDEITQLYASGCYSKKNLHDFIQRTNTLSDYIRNDLIYSKKHVEMMYRRRAFAGYIVAVMKLPLGIEMVDVALISEKSSDFKPIFDYLNSLEGKWKGAIKADINGNFGHILLPVLCYNGFAQSLNVLANCSMLHRDKLKGLPGLLMKQGDKAKDIYNLVEMNNRLILDRIMN